MLARSTIVKEIKRLDDLARNRHLSNRAFERIIGARNALEWILRKNDKPSVYAITNDLNQAQIERSIGFKLKAFEAAIPLANIVWNLTQQNIPTISEEEKKRLREDLKEFDEAKREAFKKND